MGAYYTKMYNSRQALFSSAKSAASTPPEEASVSSFSAGSAPHPHFLTGYRLPFAEPSREAASTDRRGGGREIRPPPPPREGLSDCVRAALAGADADAFVHREDEDLAVADVAGAGAFDDGLDRLLDEVVVHADGEAHLLVQRHLLGGAAVHVDVAALLPAPERVGDGHLVDLAGEERLLDGVQPFGLDVGDDEFHGSVVRGFAGLQVRKFAGSKPPAAAFQVRFVRLMAATTPFAFGKSNRRATAHPQGQSTRSRRCLYRNCRPHPAPQQNPEGCDIPRRGWVRTPPREGSGGLSIPCRSLRP